MNRQYTIGLIVIHLLLLLSGLYLYNTFFFTALSWLGLLTFFIVATIFQGNKYTKFIYLLIALAAMANELYVIITYRNYVDNTTTNESQRSWLDVHYLIFVVIHGCVGLVAIILSFYRQTLYHRKPDITFIL